MFPGMKRISNELRAASCELRANQVRFCSWRAAYLVCALLGCTSAPLMAQNPDTTFKVEVKLVNVFVTVTDTRGAPVASLQKEDFVLKEDGKEQKIAVFSRESALPLSI